MATDCLTKIERVLKNPIPKKWNEETGEVLEEIWKMHVPCGKCARCITRRKIEWAFRMTQEMKDSNTAYFVTLTYERETVPYSNKGQKTLDKADLQKFWKRLRQNQKRSNTTIEHLYKNLARTDKIKYYAAGEYGDEKNRPHYHAIIYNASRTVIEKSWTLGHTQVVPASEESIAYVTKYLDKRISDPEGQKRAKKVKLPEYNEMSEKIGYSYIEKNKEWHLKNPDVLYVTTPKGFKIPMPRYYREKIFNYDQRIEQAQMVEELLTEQENEAKARMGPIKYEQAQYMKLTESEKRFKKKMKKRTQE